VFYTCWKTNGVSSRRINQTGNIIFSNNVTLTYIASLACVFINDSSSTITLPAVYSSLQVT
jgi:hypothetical protein